MQNLETIGDTLIDVEAVQRNQARIMNDSYESYVRAVTLLGYFSQLQDYHHEYTRLLDRVSTHRKEFIDQYKQKLLSDSTKLKQVLIPPSTSVWFKQGVNKYKKVKNYSIYYYRRKLYITLEEPSINISVLKKIIDTIISLDKYYDIYEETIGFFMQTSARFEEIMRHHFSDCIHL